ncbi:exosortase/archaeosortase family protein [Cerasicoccus frondis]|uniref:exosortase/archaeosortase family protein n=1 Tax=Cerasicoccus frondis TaxID=490090 RepID=UPI002852C835|nr:exosortase/archaeosortase family protein [Cerasicoccus frondis]
MNADSKPPLQGWINLAAPLVLWGLLWSELSAEWMLNDQYGYGLFVPVLGGYLLMRRWSDRPEPAPKGEGAAALWLMIGVMTLLLFPFRIIYDANADWRLLTWIQGLLTLTVTLAFLLYWGGRPWVRHFAPAIVFWLFANPWVVTIEKPIVNGLMTMVAGWVVESANLLGVFAERSGNIIKLSRGLVSVEEACSGVRSLQSTLMASYFLGELLRFQWRVRIGLIVSGCLLAVFFNYVRTLVLTVVTAREGAEVMERWHDPAGYMVFVMSLFGLLMLTAIAQKFRPDHIGAVDGAPLPEDFSPRLLPATPLVVAMAAMLASLPAVTAWYAWRSEPVRLTGWDFNWEAMPTQVEFQSINPRIEEVLHYSEGELAQWQGPGKLTWMAYFLRWDSARAAQLGGIHRPEACLPASGFKMVRRDDDFFWQGPEGLELAFNTYLFRDGDDDMYVFYCQWDKTNFPYHQKTGRFQLDRFTDTWNGERKDGKIKLEIFVFNARTRTEALSGLKDILAKVIEPEISQS